MMNEMTNSRDELLAAGINMLNQFVTLDRYAAIAYDVPSTEVFRTKIEPWIKLKNDCVLWQLDIGNFARKYKIDFPIWCNLLCPPKASSTLIGGLGVGGPYTASIIDQIAIQLKKGLNILKRINEDSIVDTEAFIPKPLDDVSTIFFKELKNGDRKIDYVLNSQFEDPQRTHNKKSWRAFYEIAEKESVTFDTKEEAKALQTYFNSDKRNPLFATGKFQIKKLLVIEDGRTVKKTDGFFLKIFSNKEWQKRINASKTALKK